MDIDLADFVNKDFANHVYEIAIHAYSDYYQKLVNVVKDYLTDGQISRLSKIGYLIN